MAKIDLPLFQLLEFQLEGAETIYEARALDVRENAFLLRVPDDLCELEPERLTLSFGHQGYNWQVPARIQAVYESWWFIERPDLADCRRLQRRAFVRIAFDTTLLGIPIGQNGQQAGAPVPMALKDLSANGCLADSDYTIGNPGDRLLLLLSLPGVPTLTVTGELARKDPRPDGSARYGIHFPNLQEAGQEQIAKFVAKEIRNNLEEGQDITKGETGPL
jgi:c-di-GMP-binding flagellar brake protein YcgR